MSFASDNQVPGKFGAWNRREIGPYLSSFFDVAAKPLTTNKSPARYSHGSAERAISTTGQLPVITTTTPPIAPIIMRSKVDTSGESAYVKHMNDSPTVHLTANPIWIDDKGVTTCHMCSAKFTTFTRKHHCRQCGNIFCSTCCWQKKIVKYPAKNSSSKEDAGKPLRVCNACLRLNVLF